MKYINKFLFFLICIFIFEGFFSTYNAYAKNLNRGELKIFLDNTTKENFEKYKLPSLSMIVVKEGQVIYANALGYADRENKVKANVDTSVYRIGSISKLFTETAIMQLYEQGKINLKEDANKYLKDIKIQNSFNKKVTVENLLTHTSGIDEATTPYGVAKTQEDMIPLSEFLKKHPPVVVTEPGKICLYSNIGLDILGNIIENVSGMKYEDYIQKNIFNVLEMKNSKVALPLNNMAKNYDSLAQSKYYYYNGAPAGGINSTSSDIAKFMMAHLQNGGYKNKKLLNQDSAKLMHERHFSNDNNLLGVTYGFWEKNFNGRRVIGHEGALAIGFYGDMILYPEENLGIYIISNNLTNAAPAIANIEKAFFNRFYSDNAIKDNKNKISFNDAEKYVGTYRSYHDSSKTNFLKFMSFLGAIGEDEDVKIDYDKNKNALIYHGISHLKQREDADLIKVSNNLFRRVDNNELVAFRQEKGKIKYVFLNNTPYDSFEKVSLKDNYKINLVIFIASVIFFTLQILRSMFIFFKKLYKRETILNTKENKFSRMGTSNIFKLMIFVMSLLNITALLGIMYWIGSFDTYYSVTWYINISLILLIVSTVLVIVSTIILALSINKEKNKLYYKILSSLSLLILYAFIAFLYNWNLIGFKC